MKRATLIRLLGIAVLSLVWTAAAEAKDWKEVRVATEGAYPPWNATEPSGELVGFDIDVIKEVCKRVGLKCEIIPQAWKGIIPGLNAGKYDCLIAGMQITEKRLEVIDFAGPYAMTPGSFATTKGSPIGEYNSPLELITLNEIDEEEQKVLDEIRELLKGKVIGVQTTTTHSNFLDTYFKDVAKIRKYDTQENVLLDLNTGRIDAAEASLSYWVPIMKKDLGKNVVLFGPHWTGDIFGLGNGIGVRKTDPELKALLQKGIDMIRADGTLQKLAVKWFGFDNSPK
ncbi:MAG TPA: transporter substrate-binding domain-containing protein [Desulfobacteraceae bacterium]|nr:transporter substrate-binding domain-containing protein [Desulfobacteraceae bacterium]